MPDDSQLDVEQRQAVRAQGRAIAVLAGPGSGKTRVLSFRARHLLGKDRGSKALLLTFTNKAAAEMKSRAIAVSTVASDRVRSHTYHSFCMRVLRSHGAHVGITSDFEVMDQEEQKSFAANAARAAGVHNHYQKWSSVRLQRLLPPAPVAEFGETYEEAKRRECVVDYDDLIVYTADLLQQNPQIAAAYGAKYRHLLIDEFQDTNAAQFAMIRQLANHTATVSVFADDDQAIFRFAGAEVENISRYCQELQAQEYPLTVNYRCREKIVTAANRLILADNDGSGRQMTAHRPGGEVRSLVFRDIEEEAGALTSEISEIVGGGCDPSSIAVLVRSGYRAQKVLGRLVAAGLPVTSWLTSAVDTTARRTLRASLSVVRPRLGERAARDLCDILRGVDPGTRDTAIFLEHFEGQPGIEQLAEAHRLAAVGSAPLPVVKQVCQFITDAAPDTKDLAGTLCEGVAAFQEFDPEYTLDHVLSELALLGGSAPPTRTGGIKVASLHRTKGLQWPRVYLVGMEDGHIPDHRADDDEKLREERRLCFVGVCRAEDSITLTRFRQFKGYIKAPSPFLSELSLEDLPP